MAALNGPKRHDTSKPDYAHRAICVVEESGKQIVPLVIKLRNIVFIHNMGFVEFPNTSP
jgi:hypothetical protein